MSKMNLNLDKVSDQVHIGNLDDAYESKKNTMLDIVYELFVWERFSNWCLEGDSSSQSEEDLKKSLNHQFENQP